MKAQSTLLFLLMMTSFLQAQNVGIGTTTPVEKFDVNGNVNVSGQLKFNSNEGNAGQVLIKDVNNNPVWGDLSEYKNLSVFDCFQVIGGGGAGNCSNTWTVPAGVTKILVECWGGGGGGGTTSGAGGGGYVSAKFNVAPGNTGLMQIGAGGSILFAATGVPGGTSLFSINGMAEFASGGFGAAVALTSNYTITLPAGGSFSVSGITDNYFGSAGSTGIFTKQLFSQVNATTFADIRYYGDGGDAALVSGSGGRGGFYQAYNAVSQTVYSPGPLLQGGGGAADPSGGTNGRGGRIIIHY